MDWDPSREQVQGHGSFVKIRYRLRTLQGEYVKGDPREGYAYLEFFTGYNQVLPALEKNLLGKAKGMELRLCLSPAEAFGPYRQDLLKERSLEEFPEGRSLEPGKWASARDERTRTAYSYYVKEKDEHRIVLDFNHPLAGRDLVYELKILEVRPATAEEKELLRPCETEEGDVRG
ncbi:MAG: FKBP-type peptidyl-prolyl cis-trans isomerase [bacterium]